MKRRILNEHFYVMLHEILPLKRYENEIKVIKMRKVHSLHNNVKNNETINGTFHR